jgi:hypothetical protein
VLEATLAVCHEQEVSERLSASGSRSTVASNPRLGQGRERSFDNSLQQQILSGRIASGPEYVSGVDENKRGGPKGPWPFAKLAGRGSLRAENDHFFRRQPPPPRV